MNITAVRGAVLLAVLAVYVHASYSDLKRREVSDLHWALVFAMAALLFAVGENGLDAVPSVTAAVSVVLMAADLMWDRELSSRADILLYLGILASVLITLALSWGTGPCLSYASVPAVYLLMNLLYLTGVVRGGADAKAVIALAAVMPAYVSGGVPTGNAVYLFPPALTVLLYSALMTAALVLVYLAINIARHDVKMPQALMGKASLPPQRLLL